MPGYSHEETEKIHQQNKKMLELLKDIQESGAWFCSAFEINGWPAAPSGEDFDKRIDDILNNAGLTYQKNSR